MKSKELQRKYNVSNVSYWLKWARLQYYISCLQQAQLKKNLIDDPDWTFRDPFQPWTLIFQSCLNPGDPGGKSNHSNEKQNT